MKRLGSVGFQLHDVPEMAKSETGHRSVVARGPRAAGKGWPGEAQGLLGR